MAPILKELLDHAVELRTADAAICKVLGCFDQHAKLNQPADTALEIGTQALIMARKKSTLDGFAATAACAFHLVSFELFVVVPVAAQRECLAASPGCRWSEKSGGNQLEFTHLAEINVLPGDPQVMGILHREPTFRRATNRF